MNLRCLPKNILFIWLFLSPFLINAQLPAWLWADDSPASDGWGDAIAVDSMGNAFVLGRFSNDSITFGNITIFNHNISISTSSDVFVVKYNTLGIVQWVRHVGGDDFEFGWGIDIDNQGNVYITGGFGSDSLWIDNTYLLTNSSANSDIFLVKYNTNGNLLLSQIIGGTIFSNEAAEEISVDANGNLYLIGTTNSNVLYFGNDTLNGTGFRDVFVVKYDSAINPVWARISGGNFNSNSIGTDLVTDSDGNLYISGVYYSLISFENDTMVSSGGTDIFVVKYDSVGNLIWTKNIWGSINDQARGLTIDANNNLFITGVFESSMLHIDNATLINYSAVPQFDIYIAKLNSSGNLLWARNAGGNGNDWSRDIKTDGSGNAYIVGDFASDTITIGSTMLTNYWNTSGYLTNKVIVVRYDQAGNIDWVCNSTGNSPTNFGIGIDLDPLGAVYISGNYAETISFGSYMLNSLWASFYIAKLDSSSFTSVSEMSTNEITPIIFPNPCIDFFNIECAIEISDVEIFDITGKLISSYSFDRGNKRVVISTPDTKAGIYITKVKTGKQDYFCRLIIGSK